jgi:hypothetical protein
LLLGDGNDGTEVTNARYSLRTLPAKWRTHKSSPAYRHMEGAYYAFIDDHVEWIRPEKIASNNPGNANATFAIK